jgi:hypothetical protein
MNQTLLKIAFIHFLTIGLISFASQDAAAAPCQLNPVVTSFADAGAGSLRQAVLRACPNSTITFVLNAKGNTIYLSSGQITLDKNLIIQGPGASRLTVRNISPQSSNSRLFRVDPAMTVSISGLAMSGGNGQPTIFHGGGILNYGNLTITNSIISDNHSDAGGAIFNFGSLTVINSTITGNSVFSGGSGGGIYNSGSLTVFRSTFSGNSAASGIGGGIYNEGSLNVTDSTLNGNQANHGGGIQNSGMLAASNSTFSSNTASADGGGINNTGTFTLVNSTLSFNSANAHGGITNYGTLSVANSTLSGNSSSGYGGGVGNYGDLTVTNSTLYGNSAYVGGGGILQSAAGFASLGNTIIAGNIVVKSSAGNSSFDFDGTLTSRGNNLIGNTTGMSGYIATDIINQPAQLDVLANNGGPTLTHALLPGSPAIDTGDYTLAKGLATDQRGYRRIWGSAVDIGAFESK